MKLNSQTLPELRDAVAEGETLWALDTGTDGEDDVLSGTRDEVIADILYHFDLDELPAHWTLEPITLEALEERFG